MSTATVPRVSGYPVPATGAALDSEPIRTQIVNIVDFLEGANIATGNVDTSEIATLGTANTWTGNQTFTGRIIVDDATDSTSGTTGSIQTDGGIGAVKNIFTDATLNAAGDTSAGDNAAMGYNATEGLILTGQGSTNDVTIKNDANTAVISIPTGAVGVTFAGTVTTGGNIVSDTDSTDDLGTTSVRWANLWVDAITVTQGGRIDLDTDADTSIRASADDTIMFEVAGADDFSITANSFNVLTGSVIDFADNASATFGDGDDATILWDGTDLVINSGNNVSFSDGNITNVGNIALDSISADGTNIDINSGAGVVNLNTTSFPNVNIHRDEKSNTSGLELALQFDNSDDAIHTYATVRAEIQSNTAGSENGLLIFKTHQSGTDTEVMRCDQSGNVNITGLTASQDVQTDGSKNLVSVSDMNWKNDLGVITGGIDIVKQLTPRYFDWKKDASGDIPTEDKVWNDKTKSYDTVSRPQQPRLAGFFSQEVFSVFPEGSPGGANVDAKGKEHWGLNSRAILAVVVSAVQEAITRIETLENK